VTAPTAAHGDVAGSEVFIIGITGEEFNH